MIDFTKTNWVGEEEKKISHNNKQISSALYNYMIPNYMGDLLTRPI